MSFLHISTEGDLITIIDSSDLNLAKQLSRLLKITIFGEFTKNASENLSYFFKYPLQFMAKNLYQPWIPARYRK